MEESVQIWVNQQNIKRFKEQIDDANEVQRATLLSLLAEEEIKGAEANRRARV